MTAFDRFDPFEQRIAAAIDEIAASRSPGYLSDILEQTAHAPQRPRWTFPGRWLPAGTTLPAGPAAQVPTRIVVLLLLGLLLAASVGVGLSIGSRQAVTVVVPATASPQPSVTGSPSTPIAILPGEPWLVYASPSGSRTGGGLILVREDGTDRHEILASPDARLDHPDWSRDGTMLAFDSWSQDDANPGFDRIDIWIADADGANARRVTSCESPCLQRYWAAWSPDGTELAVVRYDLAPDRTWGPSAIEIVDLASGDIRVVSETADGLTAYYTPRWSPDGGRIVFGQETYTDASQSTLVTSTLAVVNVDGTEGTEPAILAPPDLEARYPDWHPKEDRIVFEASQVRSGASTTDLYVVQADGTDLTNLTDFGGRDRGAEMPTWSPDGLHIWYSQQTGSPFRAAAVMAPDGSDQTRVSFDLAAAPRLRPTP